MIIEFHDNETEKICVDKSYARKFFMPNVVERLHRIMFQLASYDKFEMFRCHPGSSRYNIHQLHGKEKDLTSIRLDFKSRMTLKVFVNETQDKIIIWEVSNHYGD